MHFCKQLNAMLIALVMTVSTATIFPEWENEKASAEEIVIGEWADITYNGSMGASACIGLTKDGKLYVWGEGESDDGTRKAAGRCFPVRIPFSEKIIDVCNSYALTVDGDVYYISYAESSPKATKVLSDIKTLYPDAAIKNNGDLYLLGDVFYDGNGHNLSSKKSDPFSAIKVEGLSNVVSAYNGKWTLAAVTEDGSLYTWGSNQAGQSGGNGQLGYYSHHPEYKEYNQLELYPQKVAVENVLDAQFSERACTLYILQTDGTLLEPKYDFENETVSFVPIFEDIRTFSCGSSFHGGGSIMAVSKDDRLFVKGDSIWGFGDGNTDGWEITSKEVTHFGKVEFPIVIGDNYAILTKDGEAYTWGDNTRGVIGNGKTAEYDSEGLGDPNTEDVFEAYNVQLKKIQQCGDNAYWDLDSNGELTISGSGAMWDFDRCEDIAEYNKPDALFAPYLGMKYSNVTIENGITAIGNWAFQNWLLKEILLPNTLLTIGDYAFAWCGHLKEIEIPASVTSIGQAALYQSHWEQGGLAKVTILNPNCNIYDNENTILDQHYENYGEPDCKYELSNTVICGFEGSTAESYAKKYNRTFEKLDGAQCGDSLYFRLDGGTAYITGSGEMWDFDNHKSEVGNEMKSPFTTYRDKITLVQTDELVTSIGDSAFYNCNEIEDIQLNQNINRIGTNSFIGCNKLKKFSCNDANRSFCTDKGILYSIDKSELICFPAGINVDFYSLPKTVKTIRAGAFNGCQTLKLLAIPNEDVEISVSAFDNSGISILMGQKNSQVEKMASTNLISFASLNGFIPDRDGNSFTNNNKSENDGFYNIKDHHFKKNQSIYMEKLSKYVSNPIVKLKQSATYSSWKGACYGIASTMALNFNGTQNIAYTVTNEMFSDYYDLEKPYKVTDLNDLINYYHISQATSMKTANTVCHINILEKGFDSQMESFLKQLTEELSAHKHKAYLLDYSYESPMTAHAIIAYSCVFDSVQNRYLVGIYDENGFLPTIMTISPDYKKFGFIDANGNKIGNLDGYGFISIHLVDVDGFDSNFSFNKNIINLKVNMIQKFKLTNASNQSHLFNNENRIPDEMSILDVIPISNGDETAGEVIYQIEKSNKFVLNAISDEIDVDLYTDTDEYFGSLKGNYVQSADFDLSNNSIVLDGNAMNFTTFLSTGNKLCNAQEGIISVTGSGNGKVYISAEGGKVKLQSDNLISNLHITSYIDDEEITAHLEDTNNLSFTVNDDGTTDLPISRQLGDVNDDNCINAKDAAEVLIAAAKIGTGKASGLTTEQENTADVDGNGVINAKDAGVILRYAAAMGTGSKAELTDFI